MEKNEENGTLTKDELTKDDKAKDISKVGLLETECYVKIYNHILSDMEENDISDLYNGSISVINQGYKGHNEPNKIGGGCQEEDLLGGSFKVIMDVTATDYLNTVEAAQSILGIHELMGRGYIGWKENDGNHGKVYELQMEHSSWEKLSPTRQQQIINNYRVAQKKDREIKQNSSRK